MPSASSRTRLPIAAKGALALLGLLFLTIWLVNRDGASNERVNERIPTDSPSLRSESIPEPHPPSKETAPSRREHVRQNTVAIALPEFVIHGRVLNANGSPKKDAEVSLAPVVRNELVSFDNLPVKARTDMYGEFSFSLEGEGHHLVFATSPGNDTATKDVVITRSSPVAAITLILKEAFAVGGRVVDDDGHPIRGAGIALVQHQSWTPLERTQTSAADGSFQFEGLSFESFRVTVSANGFVPTTRYFTHPQGAFEIVLNPAATIYGRVLDTETNEPVPDFQIQFTEHMFPSQVRGTSDFRGLYRVESVPNVERLMAGGGFEGSWLLVEPIELGGPFPPGSERQVDLFVRREVSAFGRLTGRVTLESKGTPVAGAQVWSFSWPGGPRFASTDKDGRFVLDDVPCGKVKVYAVAEGLWPSQPNASIFDLSPETTREVGDITLVQGTFVSGRVISIDGETIQGATITATGRHHTLHQLRGLERPDLEALADTRTDSDGKFSFHGLPAYQTVTLTATHPHYALGQILDVDTRSDVPEVDLRLEEGRTVKGRLLQPDGAPAASWLLMWRPKQTQSERRSTAWDIRTRADSLGYFYLEGLGPEGVLAARLPDGSTSSEAYLEMPPKLFSGDDGEVVEVTLAMSSCLELRGTILDASGVPIQGASVLTHDDLAGTVAPRSMRAQTDAHGRFTFKGLAPGALELNVWIGNDHRIRETAHAGALDVKIVLPQ